MRRIPEMPQGCKLLRWWPPRDREGLYIVGYPHKITDPLQFIGATVKRLDRALAGDRSEPFTVEGLLHRLHLLGVIIEVEETSRGSRRRADARTACRS
jgi:hypothetical protein